MKKEYSIKRELKRLASIRGSGTELISLYVPPGTQISDVTGKLRDEHGQAANIKSKTTRTNVQSAIDKILQYLKLYKQPPVNGMAIFCGNISSEQAKPNIELFSIEPPAPIHNNIYRCDSTFLLEPIEAMMESTDAYAIVVMDGRDATVALLRGTQVVVEKKLHSLAHAKINKGGQSANRYRRLIEESIDEYYKRIGDSVNDLYAKHSFKIKGLIVGGPGPSKENFAKAGVLNYQIKVLGVFDTGYTDESAGVNELLEKSKEVLEKQEAIREREVMERFLNEIARGGLAVAGYRAVRAALERNNVSRMMVSDGADLVEVKYSCTLCLKDETFIENGASRHTKHQALIDDIIAAGRVPNGADCEGTVQVSSEKDAVEELIDMADRGGVDIVFVSESSQYGRELLMGFGGVAAMLRYKQ